MAPCGRNVMQLPLLLLLLVALLGPLNAVVSDFCDEADDHLSLEYDKIIADNSTVRKVDLEVGVDEEECLNANRTSSPRPCSSLHYALHGDKSGMFESAGSDLVVHLGPGIYRSLVNNKVHTTKIINSHRVAFIGAGASRTTVVCGVSGDDEKTCIFLNFQILKSTHVLISGITFTGCGPITSPLFFREADYVFIENCTFENNTSPAVIFYNTPKARISNCSFLSNHPEELEPEVAHSTCFQPLGEDTDTFFLDNRTSGGGLTYYSEDVTTKLIIQDGLFVDNNARPNLDVDLIRRSGSYGHGGALSIRLLNNTNSTVCIRDSKFLRNFAEAHAGAMAVTVAKSSTDNKIVVLRSVFRRNMCQIENCTGGAVGVYFFSGTLLNTILFVDCNFTNNEARSSGAMVLSTSVSASGESDILRLTNCQFKSNQAFYDGTALGVFSLTQTNQVGIPVELESCFFFNNTGTNGSLDTTAVTVYRVLLTLLGNTTFRENIGGGLALLSSRLNVKEAPVFDHNIAVFGAGIAMLGRSLILLHKDSSILFSNNYAYEVGAGLYVKDLSSDFTLSILNIGCFIRYNTSQVDIPPNEWETSAIFKNNTAAVAGAAIYANDMSRCRWLGTETACSKSFLGKVVDKPTIFDLSPECSPFKFDNNKVKVLDGALARGEINNQMLATDSKTISAKANYTVVGYGESLAVILSSEDDQGNFREAVWTVSSPSEPQSFGALSSNNTVYTYTVPSKSQLLMEASALSVDEKNINFSVAFTLFLNESSSQSVLVNLSLSGSGCHPGYVFDNKSQTCVCLNNRDILRCDSNNRYFYARDGLWVGAENGTVYFSNTIPGFLKCDRAGSLPGCKFKFDYPDQQCAIGRNGSLCGNCESGYGATFDLRYCKEGCSKSGLLLFLFIVIITPIISLAILYFDLPLPNELKGVIFYAQVVGVIYRSTPYFNEEGSSGAFFDFVANMFGFAMPIPLCISESLPAYAVALLGYVPPGLAIVTAITYGLCARHVKMLSHREQYGFHGFYFLLFFIYKYIIDTSFILVSCTNVNGNQVFLYQGTLECYKYPFVLLVVLGSSLLVLFGVVLPLYILKIIYAPGKMIYIRNALTHGLKNKRKYLWYGLWDIWRRLLFVAASLLISITSRSIVLFIHSLLILFCLWVLCFTQPYQKYYINVIEGLMILSLFSTTMSVYDRENDFHVGRRVGIVALTFPFIVGTLLILYRIIRLIWKKLWPMFKERHMVESKLEKIQKKCSEIAGAVKGKTMSLVGDKEQDTDELSLKRTHGKTELQESFSADLRETLLENIAQT